MAPLKNVSLWETLEDFGGRWDRMAVDFWVAGAGAWGMDDEMVNELAQVLAPRPVHASRAHQAARKSVPSRRRCLLHRGVVRCVDDFSEFLGMGSRQRHRWAE